MARPPASSRCRGYPLPRLRSSWTSAPRSTDQRWGEACSGPGISYRQRQHGAAAPGRWCWAARKACARAHLEDDTVRSRAGAPGGGQRRAQHGRRVRVGLYQALVEAGEGLHCSRARSLRPGRGSPGHPATAQRPGHPAGFPRAPSLHRAACRRAPIAVAARSRVDRTCKRGCAQVEAWLARRCADGTAADPVVPRTAFLSVCRPPSPSLWFARLSATIIGQGASVP